MRLVAVSTLKEHVKLAKPVYNEAGQILIGHGVPLTKQMIFRLQQLGITFVYMEDKKTEDIVFNPAVTDRTRQEALSLMKQSFEGVVNTRNFNNKFSFDKMERQFKAVIREMLDQIKEHKEAVSLLSNVCAHDNYILAHSLNVMIYTLALSLKLQLKSQQLEEIGLGAMLHDVGKILIPQSILMKPSRLTNEEYEEIKKHAEYGFNILRKEHTIPLPAAHCAYQHHERINGTGYPRGLVGDQIHLYGKILGITDVYDAVTSNRIYRQAMLPSEGLEILYAGAGTQFDAEMVKAFRKSIVVYPNGLTVHLNDNRKGVVLRQTPHISDRPVLLILEEEDRELDEPYELDLSKELTVIISETDTTLLGKKKEQA
ncbi:HD-GYP domain-containing protein [Bacillus sp. REN10]|uniref:HD-GYP domain-containing protein n=1 Tax=Bacillus sp. REN10 TaxID=2782541 RepID=UPI00193BD3CE|nr:HD-GYP domain-containing protein [Bacillus sp. REN10]